WPDRRAPHWTNRSHYTRQRRAPCHWKEGWRYGPRAWCRESQCGPGASGRIVKLRAGPIVGIVEAAAEDEHFAIWAGGGGVVRAPSGEGPCIGPGPGRGIVDLRGGQIVGAASPTSHNKYLAVGQECGGV